MMVTLLDVAAADQAEILDKILGRFGAGRRLVFVISTRSFGPFLARKAAFEFLMPIEDQVAHGDLMDWPDYLEEKWALILEKWKPRTIVAYGTAAERFLEASRAARPAERR